MHNHYLPNKKRVNYKSLIGKFAFIFIIICSFVGFTLISTLIHEFSHKQDYKDVAINQSICAFYLRDASASNLFDIRLGSYYFIYNTTNETLAKLEKIESYTEKKAYFLEFLLTLIYGFCLVKMGQIYFTRLK